VLEFRVTQYLRLWEGKKEKKVGTLRHDREIMTNAAARFIFFFGGSTGHRKGRKKNEMRELRERKAESRVTRGREEVASLTKRSWEISCT